MHRFFPRNLLFVVAVRKRLLDSLANLFLYSPLNDFNLNENSIYWLLTGKILATLLGDL